MYRESRFLIILSSSLIKCQGGPGVLGEALDHLKEDLQACS